MGFLQTIGESIAAYLKPILEAKATELIDTATEAIKAEIRAHMPAIIEAVVIAVSESLGKAAAQGIDHVTDLVPGTLDDELLDGLIPNILKRLGL